VTGLLAAAAVVSFLLGDVLETAAILLVLLANGAIGFWTELRATRSMEALAQLVRLPSSRRRGGLLERGDAHDLVPGDVVVVEAGDVVPADARVVRGSLVEVDESLLTGESAPVAKSHEAVHPAADLAERRSMLYSGTTLSRGRAEAVVVATGRHTQLGRIAELTARAADEKTPMEKRLNELGARLTGLVLVLALVIAALALWRGAPLAEVAKVSIALAVAAIPEGLPIVATLALARGMLRMARRNAIVTRLSSVETLGGVDVLCVDKTGTLTENRMTVVLVATEAGEWAPSQATRSPEAAEALRIGALCNDAALTEPDAAGLGDPMEVALRRAALHAGVPLDAAPRVREVAFDPTLRMMATYHREADGTVLVAVKGAPDVVLARATTLLAGGGEETPMTEPLRRAWAERNQALASEGLRVLALARRRVADERAEPYDALCLVGLVGLMDPPRADAARTVQEFREAGVKVVMLTGDQPATATAIAQQVGLVDGPTQAIHGRDLRAPDALTSQERERVRDARVLARVTPEQKLDLVALHRGAGSVVAMTGDGANDAPALRAADIGVAMGLRGTQAAREAADIVLEDDALSTIAAAIEQGRVIFGNVRRAIVYLLSCNVSELMVVAFGVLLLGHLPLLPLQILVLNLLTDVFPALALAVLPGDRNVMRHPPRPRDEPLLTRRSWMGISGYAAVLTAAVLGAFAVALYAWRLDETTAVTVSFLTLGLAQLWHVHNMRDPGSTLVGSDVARSPQAWGALAGCALVLLGAPYLPPLALVLDLAPLGLREMGLVLGSAARLVGTSPSRGP
jgi:Ca2+-transporting ATPase